MILVLFAIAFFLTLAHLALEAWVDGYDLVSILDSSLILITLFGIFAVGWVVSLFIWLNKKNAHYDFPDAEEEARYSLRRAAQNAGVVTQRINTKQVAQSALAPQQTHQGAAPVAESRN